MNIKEGDLVRVHKEPSGMLFRLKGCGAVVQKVFENHATIFALEGPGTPGSGTIPIECLKPDNSYRLRELAKLHDEKLKNQMEEHRISG